jgi:hypothetical protein
VEVNSLGSGAVASVVLLATDVSRDGDGDGDGGREGELPRLHPSPRSYC